MIHVPPFLHGFSRHGSAATYTVDIRNVNPVRRARVYSVLTMPGSIVRPRPYYTSYATLYPYTKLGLPMIRVRLGLGLLPVFVVKVLMVMAQAFLHYQIRNVMPHVTITTVIMCIVGRFAFAECHYSLTTDGNVKIASKWM